MSLTDNLFGVHAAALSVRQQRMSILASNIANAATPNYKARDIDFHAALQSMQTGKPDAAAIKFRVPLQASLDGNTVELPTEQTAFAENALAYRTSLSFLQSRIEGISRALRGE